MKNGKAVGRTWLAAPYEDLRLPPPGHLLLARELGAVRFVIYENATEVPSELPLLHRCWPTGDIPAAFERPNRRIFSAGTADRDWRP
jgi:hypothetical protein